MKEMRKIRKAKGLTMKELGSIVGVTESAISQYETGKRQADYEMLLKLSEALGCSVDDLFNEEKEKPAADEGDGLKFALFGGDADKISDEALEEVLSFARYVKQKELGK